MATIGELLKAARIEKGISIDDIALSTHINKIYLSDIENDVPLKLPQTYVRAFIRSFAGHVGLNPDELLQPSPKEPVGSAPDAPPAAPAVVAAPEVEPRRQPSPTVPVKQQQYKVLITLSAIIILGLIVSILFLQQQRQAMSVREVSFPEMARQQDKQKGPAAGDSLATAPPVSRIKAIDSLTLEAVSIDTVWLSLLIDSTKTREYTLPPQHRLKWKALRSFVITAGNGGSIYFTLNGMHLGTLGPANKPLKSLLLTREALQKKDKAASRTNLNEKP